MNYLLQPPGAEPMLVCTAKSNWNVETDDNDEDYQESDAKVDDEETIDIINSIMFKNYICS